MPKKTKELNNLKDGDRAACPLCNPPDKKKWVTANKLWIWAKKNPGKKIFRDKEEVI